MFLDLHIAVIWCAGAGPGQMTSTGCVVTQWAGEWAEWAEWAEWEGRGGEGRRGEGERVRGQSGGVSRQSERAMAVSKHRGRRFWCISAHVCMYVGR